MSGASISNRPSCEDSTLLLEPSTRIVTPLKGSSSMVITIPFTVRVFCAIPAIDSMAQNIIRTNLLITEMFYFNLRPKPNPPAAGFASAPAAAGALDISRI